MLCCSILFWSLARLIHIANNRHKAATQMAVRIRNIPVSPQHSLVPDSAGAREDSSSAQLAHQEALDGEPTPILKELRPLDRIANPNENSHRRHRGPHMKL